jgi:hypothetical protein
MLQHTWYGVGTCPDCRATCCTHLANPLHGARIADGKHDGLVTASDVAVMVMLMNQQCVCVSKR